MRWSPRSLVPAGALVVFLAGCGENENTLCAQFYEPYPDHVGDRERTAENAELVDAMVAYNARDFVTAAAGLKRHIDRYERDNTARMYLASALIGAGEPYKAEMHLDFLERQRGAGFKDQVEWYNAQCWLCSGQYDRALHQSIAIAGMPAHTYKEQAHRLALALSDH